MREPAQGALPEVELWTDGAGNCGPGGWAYVLRTDGREREGTGGHPCTTSQRMEMTAMLEGLRALKRRSRVTVCTDSAYLKGCRCMRSLAVAAGERCVWCGHPARESEAAA